MTGLCQRCGYFHAGDPDPAKDPGPSPELEELRALREESEEFDERLERLEEKVGILLELAMTRTEPERLSLISKIKKRVYQRSVLELIRAANRDG